MNSISQTYPSLVVADNVSPTLGTISINNGAVSIASQSVSLTLSATDNVGVTNMMISNSVGFTGASWETYATTKSWSLAASSVGTYTVYVRFRDLAGNISADYSDSINIVAASSGGGG